METRESECGCECHKAGCKETRYYFSQAQEAWKVLNTFERQFLSLANTLRGMDRSLNRRPHAGRQINKVD